MRKTIELNNGGVTSDQRQAAFKRVFGKDENDTRAAGLAAAADLLPTIMLDAFKRDDASEEFLNGMAYGAASYCSAIKALGEQPGPAAGAAPASASTTNEERLQELEQGAQTAQADGWREVCAVLEEVQPGWARRPGTGIDVAVATIRELAARRAVDPQQVAWSADMQARLAETGRDEGGDVQMLMAEAACLLAVLTGSASGAVPASAPQQKETA